MQKYKNDFILFFFRIFTSFSLTNKMSNIDIHKDCAICFERLSIDKISWLPCVHAFHTKCVNEWVNCSEVPSCPLCRCIIENTQPTSPKKSVRQNLLGQFNQAASSPQPRQTRYTRITRRDYASAYQRWLLNVVNDDNDQHEHWSPTSMV